jgi:hypothetical protein
MKLESQTLPVSGLRPDCIAQMERLMRAHYEGVSESLFRADLAAKQWVILLLDNGGICGFSTQVLFDCPLAGRDAKILFSGDTIIDKKHWGSLALPLAWGRLMLSLCAAHPASELFWLLTSKGYKTYRFLPVFFHEFYPCFARETPPFEKALLESAARRRFGGRFDPAACILRAEPGAQRLREGIAEIDAARLRDPHVAFFQEKNPGHARGDELVCLARFHAGNLKPYIRRQL